jgi:hypothetical protein
MRLKIGNDEGEANAVADVEELWKIRAKHRHRDPKPDGGEQNTLYRAPPRPCPPSWMRRLIVPASTACRGARTRSEISNNARIGAARVQIADVGSEELY